jgi:hypothetical protein
MLEQWVPFATITFIVLTSFITNVALGSRVADWTNSAPIEVNTPWKRPRILAGKSLVVLWFATALLYIATLPGAIVVDGVVLQISSLPALLLLAVLRSETRLGYHLLVYFRFDFILLNQIFILF